MQRILIADGSGVYAGQLAKELSADFCVETCDDGVSVLRLLRLFDPDILLLDTMLPGIDSFTVLNTLRASGSTAKVIVLSDLTDPLTVKRLSGLGVSCILAKPCAVHSIISNIRDLAFVLRYPDMDDWCVDNELDKILLSLGFRMGPARQKVIWHAVMYRYENPDSSYMKELCPAVAKLCGGNALQVEKAVRDAIRCAFEKGDRIIWQMYFPPGLPAEYKHPGADAFIARIAHCLVQMERIKPPYIPQRKQAK